MKRYGESPWSPATIGFVVGVSHLTATVLVAAASMPSYGETASTLQLAGQVVLAALLAPIALLEPVLLFPWNSAAIGVAAGAWIHVRRRRARRARAGSSTRRVAIRGSTP